MGLATLLATFDKGSADKLNRFAQDLLFKRRIN
jgi:hypothetical protein